MNWESRTSQHEDRPTLSNLTPVAAFALMGALKTEWEERGDLTVNSSEGFNKKLQSFEGTGRPIEVLLKTLVTFAFASKGGNLGDLEVHDRRLTNAWKTIDDAKKSENETDQEIARVLEDAIIKTLPYVHRMEPSRSR